MSRVDLERDELRKVNCGVVLEQDGWQVDRRESTRRAVKFRRDAEIVIVTHEGAGWFDPLSDGKGDVFDLVQHLHGGNFGAVRRILRPFKGLTPNPLPWRRPRRPVDAESLGARWDRRRKPRPRSPAWRYLVEERGLPTSVVERAVVLGVLREGPYGSIWAVHRNENGTLTGWEERGPGWRGFSTAGNKTLFRFGAPDALRVCVTEAAIDALSLVALEALRVDTLYLSTGGGWGPTTNAALTEIASQPGVSLTAATDRNSQGDRYADRLANLAREAGCGYARALPEREDWNEDLQQRAKAVARTSASG